MATTFHKATRREYAESLVIAVILALFVRTWVVQAFGIPPVRWRTTCSSGITSS
jgi:signal peptidase I